MNLLAEAMDCLGAALLPIAAALLFEELTFGGLVRLMLAPWPGARKPAGSKSSLPETKPRERKPQKGEGTCSH